MSRGSKGNYKVMKRNLEDISLDDVNNPWTFYNLFLQDEETVLLWLIKQGFICESLDCKKNLQLVHIPNLLKNIEESYKSYCLFS